MPAAPLAQSSLAPDHRDKTTEQKLKCLADFSVANTHTFGLMVWVEFALVWIN